MVRNACATTVHPTNWRRNRINEHVAQTIREQSTICTVWAFYVVKHSNWVLHTILFRSWKYKNTKIFLNHVTSSIKILNFFSNVRKWSVYRQKNCIFPAMRRTLTAF
jgi:hypothetical protein